MPDRDRNREDQEKREAELMKAATREGARAAIKEFLDEQFAKFGRWSFYGIAAMVFSALVYWAATAHGWYQ